MPHKVAFVHTVTGLKALFEDLCREIIGDVATCHIADESLIQRVLAAGGITPEVTRRVCDNAVAAAAAGADAVLVTCSSVSPCVDAAKTVVSVPVLKIDEPMIAHAVARFDRIGVIATTPTTLAPSAQLIRDTALAQRRDVAVKSVLCKGAYQAFLAGRPDEYNRIVIHHIQDLSQNVDVVLLAQASMARVADMLDQENTSTPILSSPRPAVQHLARLLKQMDSPAGSAAG